MSHRQKIGKSLVISVVVVACIKYTINPSMLKIANVVDYKGRAWQSRAESKRNPEESSEDKHSNRVLRFNTMKQDHIIRNAQSVALTTDVTIQDITSETDSIDTLSEDNGKSVTKRENSFEDLRETSDGVKSTVSRTEFTDETRIKLDETKTVIAAKSLNLRFNSSNKKVFKKHPHEMDLEMIASGKYKVEDLMKEGPFKFLKNYKSPCWKPDSKSSSDPPIRCLPYFYLIGAPKAGTTDMHRRLIKHPEISRLVVKEPHWLTRSHYYAHGKDGGYSNLTKYLRIFRYATREVFLRKDSQGYHNLIFGDCSASTLWDNDYWTILPQFRNLSEPLYTNADYIHHLNPNTKIIAILRNPVERLYSDYLFFQHGSPEQFHEGVKNIIKDTYECLQNKSLRHCIYTPFKSQSGIQIRLRIGVYHLHLKEYFRVFPRDQVLVIKLEDFSKNIASYMKKIFSFLEISELNRKDIQKIADPDQRANERRKKDRNAGEMLPETRKLLENFYRPHNDLLANLLGEKFNYNRDFG